MNFKVNFKSSERSSVGLAANRTGKSFEEMILASQSPSTVLLTKIPLSARRIRGREMVACRGPCDFLGMYVPTGRMVIFDAKSGKGDNRLETREAHFPLHQRAQIIRYGEAGAIAGLMAESSTNQMVYWCPWTMLIVPRPSIPWAEMICVGSSREVIDWRKIVEASS